MRSWPGTKAFALEAIQSLESAITISPNNWLYYWRLADLYEQAGFPENAVRSAYIAWQLRPNDRRSTYALATELRMVAQWASDEDPIFTSFGRHRVDFLALAYRLFEDTLILSTSQKESKHVHECLAALDRMVSGYKESDAWRNIRRSSLEDFAAWFFHGEKRTADDIAR